MSDHSHPRVAKTAPVADATRRRSRRERSKPGVTVPRWLFYVLVASAVLLAGLLIVVWVPAQLLSQALLPVATVLAVGAAVFFLWRWYWARTPQGSDISGMEWSEFQPLLSQFLERQGYALVESGNRPGVVDFVVRKDRQTFLVHAKSWKAGKLDIGVVSKLYDAMVSRGVGFGIVVSASKFGRGAQSFARETQIQLIDGAMLKMWFKRHVNSLARVQAEEAKLAAVPDAPADAMDTRMMSEFLPLASPSCPLCSAPMKERKATKGRFAGTKFWGCTRHPQCKGLKRWGQA